MCLSECVEREGNIDLAPWDGWGLGAVEHMGMAEGRSEWVVGAAQGASPQSREILFTSALFYLAALQVPGQVLSAKARCCGMRGFSYVEQWTEFPAVVFQPNLCAWAGVARCCRVLQLFAGSVSEPCDNFNLGIKEGLYCGLGMPATSFGSACVGNCSPPFAKKLSF